MLKKFKDNPNTVERMEQHYSKIINREGQFKDGERFNDWMMPHLEPLIPKEGHILEVGCGLGATIKHILSINPMLGVSGIDISPTAIDNCNENIEGKFWTQKAEFDIAGYYDLIICSQTLEHVDFPNDCILNMKKALSENGTLFLTVPYPKSNLDNGVKLHYWRFYPVDFEMILKGCKVIDDDKRHLIVIWKKP